MPKCLVTGGAGFIGSNLVDELIKRGDEVVIIDNLSTGRKEYINPKAKFYNIDICSKDDVKRVFQNESNSSEIDFVYHLAAQMDVRKSIKDPLFDNEVNVAGGYNIFNCALKAKVKKVVFFSTGGAIYGNVDSPADEEALPSPDSFYAAHKLTSEKHLEILNKLYGQNYIILRPANIYGPRQYKGGEGAVAAVFTYNAFNNKESIVYGDGLQTRDFVYIDDVVEACLKSAESDTQGIFNIGSGKEISVLELIDVIEKINNKKFQYKHYKERIGEVRRSVLDCNKARELLNWRAKTDIKEGLEKTIDYFKNILSL